MIVLVTAPKSVEVMVNAYSAIEEPEYSISGSLAETERLYKSYLSEFGCYG